MKKLIKSRADSNFKNAKEIWEKSNPNGFSYKNEKFLSFSSSRDCRIGFTEAIFDKTNTRDNFWVKPDFIAIKASHEIKINNPKEIVTCLCIEQCGNWNNHYQKRAYYQGMHSDSNPSYLSFFYREKGVWKKGAQIGFKKILYILREENNDHSIRTIRVSPNFNFEIFTLTYESWLDEKLIKKQFSPTTEFNSGKDRKFYINNY